MGTDRFQSKLDAKSLQFEHLLQAAGIFGILQRIPPASCRAQRQVDAETGFVWKYPGLNRVKHAPGHHKKPGRINVDGRVFYRQTRQLISFSTRSCNALAPERFALLAAAVLAWLFIAFF
jgi:hypothetical protein